MHTKRKKLLAHIVVWLAAEICLSYLGLDDLADYSEFIFEKNLIVNSTESEYKFSARFALNCFSLANPSVVVTK